MDIESNDMKLYVASFWLSIVVDASIARDGSGYSGAWTAGAHRIDTDFVRAYVRLCVAVKSDEVDGVLLGA